MRSFYLLLFVCLFISITSIGQSTSSPSSRPNIVLIVSDDQGYHDLGSYGSDEIITPHLDSLATEGVRFTNFYVTSSICTPSRSGLLTGRYPQRNGTYELFRNDRVNDGYRYTALEYSTSPERILGTDLREVFISEVLQKAGYTNGIFGKWDFGQLHRFLPLQQGFDRFYGFVNTGIDYFTHERYGVPSMYSDNTPTIQDQGTYTTDLFTREALEFIEENHQAPFFLYLPYNAPHSASNLDPEIRRSVQAPEESLQLYPEGSTTREKQARGYRAAVTRMDESIGKILNRISSYGLEETTIIVFLSDNGGGIGSDNSPLRGRKGQFWEGGIRVPCIIKWPGVVESGTINNSLVTSLDIFPTLLTATGTALPDSIQLDGHSLFPLLRGERNTIRNAMFWELRGEQAARIGKWKWISSPQRKGLFDLEEDIGEQHDLTALQPDIAQMIQERFEEWKSTMKAAEPRGPFRDF